MNDAEIRELSARLGDALVARGWFLGTAESCTGGWVSTAVTAIAGSSGWFDAGLVTYSNAAKQRLLGVEPGLIEAHGAVSGPVVEAMVAGLLARHPVQLALSVSGVAGPGGGTPEKPVGLVWFGWGTRDGRRLCRSQRFSGDRAGVRRAAVVEALKGALELC